MRQRELASGYADVATVLTRQGEADQAIAALREARKLIAQLAKTSPQDRRAPKELAALDAEISRLENGADTPPSSEPAGATP